MFLTLTYNESSCPQDGNLQPDDLRLFLRRLKHKLNRPTLRFYAVGEYGDKTQRPHYHLILFGLHPTYPEKILAELWGKGFVCVRPVSTEVMSYVMGYVVKKWTKSTPDGRTPEFASMSRNPGLGSGFVKRVVSSYRNYPTWPVVEQQIAELSSGYVNINGVKYPRDSYLKNKILGELGITQETKGKYNASRLEEAYQKQRTYTVQQIMAIRKQKVLAQAGKVEARKQRRNL